MNKTLVRILFFLLGAIALWAEVERQRSGAGYPSFVELTSVVFCVAFGKMLLKETIRDRRLGKRDGFESLPPGKEIAAVNVHGVPLSDARKQELLNAIFKATRAGTTDKITDQLPFEIVDRWGGIWELLAYKDAAGKRGFAINRIYYSGLSAEIVAQCVGV